MAECLGLYIDNNMIKYAKISKERNNIKIESYGVKQYEKLNEALNQIISETYSVKTPISINLSDEMYNYFNVFSMLSKKDIEKAIKTEFEFYCDENGINKNVIDSRYFCVPSREDDEKLRAIYISANKTEIARKAKELEKYKLRNITPLSTSITNLIETNTKENVAIINIEDRTIITIILDGILYDVKVLSDGMKQIFDKISLRENSYSKAYDLCKNTTIFTSGNKDLQISDNEYLDDIMPVLYNIIKKFKKILSDNNFNIEKIYLTGAGVVINNIDLYFQDNINNAKCEILKPYFIDSTSLKINVKEYIEVNSAIALALQGLGIGINSVNFKELTLKDKIELPQLGNSNGNTVGKRIMSLLTAKVDLDKEFDAADRVLARIAGTILSAIILYSVFSIAVNNQLETKIAESDKTKDEFNKQIALVETDIDNIKTRTSDYNNLIRQIDEINEKASEKYRSKNAIPNLLNRIMFCIPEETQLTSIKNTNDSHIVITARAKKIEQLGYFLAQMKAKEYLLNITTTSGNKSGEYINITIEGDLP